MRCYQLSGISLLTAAPLYSLAKLLAPPWDDIRVKHTWNAVPPNWETLGDPPAGTTIDLHVALMPHNESALIDELYEVSDPGSPKRVFLNHPLHARCPHMYCCSIVDMVHTSQGSKSLSLSRHIKTRWSS